MKYPLLFIFILLLPAYSFAHTSDERYVEGYVVDLSTAPVAPWVGEKVGMSFVFLDPATMRATTSVKSATISMDVMMRPNNKLQETIFQSQTFLVENGGFVTDHVFAEEGTYDMHLAFIDAAGVERVAGFRKQVRSGALSTSGVGPEIFFGTVILVTALGFVAGRLSRKNPS